MRPLAAKDQLNWKEQVLESMEQSWNYPIYSNKRPGRLFNFWSFRLRAFLRLDAEQIFTILFSINKTTNKEHCFDVIPSIYGFIFSFVCVLTFVCLFDFFFGGGGGRGEGLFEAGRLLIFWPSGWALIWINTESLQPTVTLSRKISIASSSAGEGSLGRRITSVSSSQWSRSALSSINSSVCIRSSLNLQQSAFINIYLLITAPIQEYKVS